MAAKLAIIFFTMILTNNYVLVNFLGICPFLGVSKRLDSSVGMGISVTVVMVLATAVTWPLQQLLNYLDLAYLQTIAFILIIAVLVQLLELILKKFIPPLYVALGVYLPLITTNCAVLGVAVLNVSEGYNLLYAVLNGIFGALGFLLAIVLMAGVRERLETSDIPAPFRGFPICIVIAGLMSIAFMGFSGIGG